MKFNLYKNFELNLKTDLLIGKFAPYSRNELLELVEITLNKKKDINFLYELLIKNKNIEFEEFKAILINS